MSTYYVEILAEQRPFPFDVDENSRALFSVNFSALALAPVASLEEEIAKILSDAGAATLYSYVTGSGDTFIGPAAVIPDGDGPWLQIIDTGGSSPNETHDGVTYERLSFQIIVRALSFGAARTRALAVWRALDGVRGTTVAA